MKELIAFSPYEAGLLMLGLCLLVAVWLPVTLLRRYVTLPFIPILGGMALFWYLPDALTRELDFAAPELAAPELAAPDFARALLEPAGAVLDGVTVGTVVGVAGGEMAAAAAAGEAVDPANPQRRAQAQRLRGSDAARGRVPSNSASWSSPKELIARLARRETGTIAFRRPVARPARGPSC